MKLAPFLVALAVVAGLPAAAAAQSCAAISGPGGRPAWQIRDPGRSRYSDDLIRDYCVKTCGGTFVHEKGQSWCSRTPGTEGNATGSGAALGSGQAAANAAGLAATGQLDDYSAMLGGLDAGIALNRYFDAASKRAKAKRAAEEAARRQRAYMDSLESARRRDAAMEKLQRDFRFSTQASLSMRLDTASRELGFRFDGDTARKSLTDSELATRDRTNCFFMSCKDKYLAPNDVWRVPYVDVRHLYRAAHLLRRTMYAPAEQRETAAEQVVAVAQGENAGLSIPSDAVPLPPNALERMVHVSVDTKQRTNARLREAAVIDSLQQRRDLVDGLVEAARGDATLPADRQAEAVRRLERERSWVDSLLSASRARLAAAQAQEDSAHAAERRNLVAMLTRGGIAGGPVENCSAERAAIANLRAGIRRLDDDIARYDRTAAASARDARASIERAKISGQAGAMVLDDFKQAVLGHLGALRDQLEHALLLATAPDRATLTDVVRTRRRYEKAKALYEQWSAAWEKGFKRIVTAKAQADRIAASSATGTEAVIEVMDALQEADLLEPLLDKLVAHPAVAARGLGPWATLGVAYINTTTATGEALVDDATARHTRNLAQWTRELRRTRQSELDEREARVLMIERQGGCIAP